MAMVSTLCRQTRSGTLTALQIAVLRDNLMVCPVRVALANSRAAEFSSRHRGQRVGPDLVHHGPEFFHIDCLVVVCAPIVVSVKIRLVADMPCLDRISNRIPPGVDKPTCK